MKIAIFTEHNVTPWWSSVADNLTATSPVVIISPFSNDGDVFIMDAFYQHYNNLDICDYGFNEIGFNVIEDIRLRCRLLRALNKIQAIRMISAMWRTLSDTTERLMPDVVISFVIDIYVTDVLDRILIKKRIPFIGLLASIRQRYIMFSIRGEYTAVRTPSDEEIEQATLELTDESFTAYLPSNANFGLLRFARIYSWWNARSIAFRFIRRFSGNPLNHHYNVTPDVIPEFRVTLGNYSAKRFIMNDWVERLDVYPFERRLFVGLQVNPEASTDYWVEDRSLIDYECVLELLASTLRSAGFALAIKEHPVMFGFRSQALFERLSRFDNVIFIPYQVPAPVLIHKCFSTFTWTGTIGFQAAMYGRCAIVTQPFYLLDPYFIVLNNITDITRIPEKVLNFKSSGDLSKDRRALVRHLLAASVPGFITDRGKAKYGNAESISNAKEIAASLNKYLPLLIETFARNQHRGSFL